VSALAGLGGALAGLGLILTALTAITRSAPQADPAAAGLPPKRRTGRRARPATARPVKLMLRRLLPAVLAAGVVGGVTRWPVGAVLAAVAGVGLPRLLGGGKAAERNNARLQALADWTRRLADSITAGAGLEDALVRSARTAPAPLAAEIGALAHRLRAHLPTELALRAFADDVDDAAGDQVAAALLLAARRQGRGVVTVLADLADTVAKTVAARRETEADRAKPRNSMRQVIAITIGFTLALGVLNPGYASRYGTPAGQAVLALAGLIYIAGCWWMAQLARTPPTPRFLPPAPPATSPAEHQVHQPAGQPLTRPPTGRRPR